MRPPALVLAAAALAGLAGTAAAEEPSRTTRDGVYTAEQAERGKERYKRDCAGCHPVDWYKGDVMKPWDGAPLGNLYELIVTTMPKNNPGSLKPKEYVSLLAFILSLNDMPTGTEELPEPSDALKKIVIKWREKP
jgi:S-disulfanyl-L-cysteine oxidoreductase SoxD